MSNIDQEQLGEWLSAYLDGELNPEQRELVERRLREDESARRLLDELRRTVNLVSSLPRHCAPGSIAEDVQLHVERSELLGEPEEPSVRSGGRRRPVLTVLSMAAALGLFAVGLRIIVTNRATEPQIGESTVAMRDTAAESALTSDQPAPPADRSEKEEMSLVATADFSRKIRAGLGTESVSTHAFANETVRLRVVARDEADREAITDKIVAYLAERRAADLAVAMTDKSDRTALAGSFYYRGDPGINYVEPSEQQVLVRASRRELEGMMDELERYLPATDGVVLVAGPLSIHGLRRARTALYGLEEPAPAVTMGRGPYSLGDKAEAVDGERGEKDLTSPDTTPPRIDELFDGLLKTIGLDREMLAGPPTPKPDAAPAGPSTSKAPTVTKAKKAEAYDRLVTPATVGAQDASAAPGEEADERMKLRPSKDCRPWLSVG